jgi:hypothetical protein
LPNQEYV